MHRIHQYIDRCLIDKGILDTDQLTEHEFANFADLLINEDTSTRQTLLVEMQAFLDERNEERALDERLERGITYQRRDNGDYEAVKRPGY